MASSQYFLGANTPNGFFSLYDQLIDRTSARAVYLLKGGAGCGKSSFMRRVGSHAIAAGLDVEYIRCSGDPDSLDGLVVPSLGLALADATSPHVLEPLCPGVIDHYINLEQYYDTEALQPLRGDILSCMEAHKNAYRECYLCLKAVGTLQDEIHTLLNPGESAQKIMRRAKGIIKRELRGQGDSSGRITRRFLSAVTCKGSVTIWDTVSDHYQRVYSIEDSNGLAHLLLDPICSAAVEKGYDVILCPAPLSPDRAEHLLIPAIGLAFVSSPGTDPFPGNPYRRIHLDSIFSSTETYHQNRARIRFTRKVASSLLSEALTSLANAKLIHDRLEAFYNPYVDFHQIYAEADALSALWFPQQFTASP